MALSGRDGRHGRVQTEVQAKRHRSKKKMGVTEECRRVQARAWSCSNAASKTGITSYAEVFREMPQCHAMRYGNVAPNERR